MRESQNNFRSCSSLIKMNSAKYSKQFARLPDDVLILLIDGCLSVTQQVEWSREWTWHKTRMYQRAFYELFSSRLACHILWNAFSSIPHFNCAVEQSKISWISPLFMHLMILSLWSFTISIQPQSTVSSGSCLRECDLRFNFVHLQSEWDYTENFIVSLFVAVSGLFFLFCYNLFWVVKNIQIHRIFHSLLSQRKFKSSTSNCGQEEIFFDCSDFRK